jgi:hypothetical protein
VTRHVHFDQAPPRSWDHFGELCADTFQEEWQDSTLVRHGRAGQRQHGVDIVGRDGAIWPVGIRCKKKSLWPVSKVTTVEVDAEVEKAKKFKPPLKVFYLISTAPDDQPLQRHARLITQGHQSKGLFTVAVIGWSELVRRATRHQHVAVKHFGSYSQGPASPLLATWRAAAGKLLLDDRELGIAIRELIHDLRDYPAGRIVFRQKESEDLLFQINRLQAASGQSLDKREAVLELRDKLKLQREREGAVVAGLTLLFGHKDLNDYVRWVWEDEAPLAIRSFVEQQIDPNIAIVTGLNKIRLLPPGYVHAPEYLEDESIPHYIPPTDLKAIFEHRTSPEQRHPTLAGSIIELPNDVQLRHLVPRVVREIVSKMGRGIPLEEIERSKWLRFPDWKFTLG